MNDRSAGLTAEPTTTPGLSTPAASHSAALPLPDLFKRLATDVGTLLGDEAKLVAAEFAEKAPAAQRSVALFVLAAVLAVGSFFALTATLIFAVSLAVPYWAAALIVTVAYVAGAGLAAFVGKSGLKGLTDPIPHAAENLKADFAALKAGFERGR